MAIFDIDEDTYVSRVWFIGDGDRDWLAMLFKQHKADTRWTLRWRFRTYKPDPHQDPFTNDDEKSASGLTFEAKPGTEEQMASIIGMAVEMTGIKGELKILEIKGGPKEFMEIFSKQPWATTRALGDQAQ